MTRAGSKWVLAMAMAAGACGGKAHPAGGSGSAQADGVDGDGGGSAAVKVEPKVVDPAVLHAAAIHAIVPEGATCVPVSKGDDDPPLRLQLGLVDGKPVLCAIDPQWDRSLGVVACWDVDASSGALAYRAPAPLPGVGVPVLLDDHHCADGYCAATADTSGHGFLAHSTDGARVVIGVPGDALYVFDAATKAAQTTIKLSDPGAADATNVGNELMDVVFVGESLYAIGTDAGPFIGVWAYHADGKRLGSVHQLGGKREVLSVYAGGVSVLDADHVGLAEQGLSTLTTVDAKALRTKIVRKVPKNPCKKTEAEYLMVSDETSAKCKAHVEKVYAPFEDASLVTHGKGFLALLRGPRAGELVTLDDGSLGEKSQLASVYCK